MGPGHVFHFWFLGRRGGAVQMEGARKKKLFGPRPNMSSGEKN